MEKLCEEEGSTSGAGSSELAALSLSRGVQESGPFSRGKGLTLTSNAGGRVMVFLVASNAACSWDHISVLSEDPDSQGATAG